MASKDRLPVVPSRLSLQQMKTKYQGASKGHSMLKKKSDALMVRFRAILKEVYEKKLEAGEESREAMMALAQAKYAFGGELKHTVMETVKDATLTLKTVSDNVAGIQLPSFFKSEAEPGEDGEGTMMLTGLGKGSGSNLFTSLPRLPVVFFFFSSSKLTILVYFAQVVSQLTMREMFLRTHWNC